MLRARHAFTIIELLVVIAVIGILATIVTVSYTGITRQTKINLLENDLRGAATALEKIKQDKGDYPATLDGINLEASSDTTYEYTKWTSGFCLLGVNEDITYYIIAKGVPTGGECPEEPEVPEPEEPNAIIGAGYYQ